MPRDALARTLADPAAILEQRLARLGLRPITRLAVHSNRTVMVSLNPEGVLRLHQGYAHAPDGVLSAIVRFLSPRTAREDRKKAERIFLQFPVERYAPVRARRIDRPQPGDVSLLTRLHRLHAELNFRHFGGRLADIPIQLSSRMRTRLGELSVDLRTHQPIEIAISRRHLERHPWPEVAHTMLHEMVHQWQAESGLAVDHGRTFREKAMEVGVLPKAKRRVTAP